MKQTVTWHEPLKGRYGDCVQACLASLLDLPLDEVPAFSEGVRRWTRTTTVEIMEQMRAWLAPGRTVWGLALPVAEPAAALDYVGGINPGQRWLLSGGTASRGINHMVCCRGAQVEHDPGAGGAIIQPLWPDRRIFGALVIGEVL